MTIAVILFQILNIALFIHAVYLALFAVSGLFRKIRVYGDSDKQIHFAVLIPARNEGSVIGNLIDSIKLCDYPNELIDIFVLANHCSDDTGQVSSRHGAQVLDCTEGTHNKADVLRVAFERLSSRLDIDAYVIFDADNIANPGFFRETNKAFATGASAVQGRRTAKNLRKTWVAACYELYYAMQNAFYNHPRNAAGLNASISGTGWAIRKDIIDLRGFDLGTITEDFEFTILCALNGDTIAYCSKALVYDEFTDKLKLSMIQRVRWTFGMLQNMRKYSITLLRKAIRGSWQCFDMFMVTLMPLVALISLITGILAYVTLSILLSVPLFVVSLIISSWIGLAASSLLAIVKSGCSVKENITGIIMFPFFIITWALIMISCFFRRNVKWVPIKHDQNVSFEDIQKH